MAEKKGIFEDHSGNELLPKTKAAQVETEDGSNVEEKLGTFLPLAGGTMTGPAVGAAGALGTAQFRNVQYGTEPLTPGESPLPQGTLYITPEARAGKGGKRTCRFVVGTSTAGWTEADCDYLCDGTADDVEINAAIQALPSTGGEIVILDGTYNIASKISLRSKVSIRGNGAATILKRKFSNTDKAQSWIMGGEAGVSDVCISALAFDGNIEEYPTQNDAYISVYVPENSRVVNSRFFDAYMCICIESPNIEIKGNQFSCSEALTGYSKAVQCTAGSSADHVVIAENIVNGFGIGLYGSKNTIFSNNAVFNASVGINPTASGNVVIGNIVRDFMKTGIELAGPNHLISGNSVFRGTGKPADYTEDQNTILTNEYNDGSIIVGNNIMGKDAVVTSVVTSINNKFE